MMRFKCSFTGAVHPVAKAKTFFMDPKIDTQNEAMDYAVDVTKMPMTKALDENAGLDHGIDFSA